MSDDTTRQRLFTAKLFTGLLEVAELRAAFDAALKLARDSANRHPSENLADASYRIMFALIERDLRLRDRFHQLLAAMLFEWQILEQTAPYLQEMPDRYRQ